MDTSMVTRSMHRARLKSDDYQLDFEDNVGKPTLISIDAVAIL